MPHTLLILTRETKEYAERVRTMNLRDCDILAPETKEGIRAAAAQATIVFGSPPILKNYINDMPRLQWVQSDFAGVDALMEEGMRRDYLLTNVKGVYGQAMAEYVLGWIMFFHRNMARYREDQTQCRWHSEPHTTLEGLTVGIMGTGSIGKVIARLLLSLQMRVIGMNRSGGMVEGFDDVVAVNQPEQFFPQADFIVSVLPRTPATDNILCAETLSLMKKSAVLMNIGRGNAVQDEDLADALREQRIKAAVIDVFRTEPLPQNHPFWGISNCYITPHVSGHMVCDSVFTVFNENYGKFSDGEPMMNVVDFSRGY